METEPSNEESKPDSPPVRKPFQSQLLPHLELIARLRNTKPQPTSYKEIARILLDKHQITISPNSIWNFVRARSTGRPRRKVKYVLDDALIKPAGPSQDDRQASLPLSETPQPVPQKPSNPLGDYYFIVRCVYLRPKCGYNVISPPSQPFQLASYFDSDAPARRIQVALPLDITAAGLRKFDKGVAFLMSDELRNQMARVPSLSALSSGDFGGAGGVALD